MGEQKFQGDMPSDPRVNVIGRWPGRTENTFRISGRAGIFTSVRLTDSDENREEILLTDFF